MTDKKEQFYGCLGKKITKLRQASAMTQQELASAIGLTRTSITNIEKGRQPVFTHVLWQIGNVLGVDDINLFLNEINIDSTFSEKRNEGSEDLIKYYIGDLE